MRVSHTVTKEIIGNTRIDNSNLNEPLSKKKFDALMDTLRIDNLSNYEKTHFQKILEDKNVTKEELSTLGYEETKKIQQFMSKTDTNGVFLTDSLITFGDLSMSASLSTQHISDDEEYNRAVFDTMQGYSIDPGLSQSQAIAFMEELDGGRDINHVLAFEEKLTKEQWESGITYKTHMGKDMNDFLDNRLKELHQDYKNSNDEVVKEDYKKFIDLYTQIQTNYNSVKSENQIQLDQYTKNTKENPLYSDEIIDIYNTINTIIDKEQDEIKEVKFNDLVKKLNIKNLSHEDKNLIRTIMEDRRITNIEMDKLSYEQVKKIGQFIEETFINMDIKAEALIKSAKASDDDSFNKALFQKIKAIETSEEVEKFMSPYMVIDTGHESLSYAQLFKGYFDGEDMNKVLDDIIDACFENMKKFDDPMTKIVEERYINEYTSFKESYNRIANEEKN